MSVELAVDAQGAGFITGVASALTFALTFLLIPRRYEVFADRFVLVFAWRRWQIPLDTIGLVRPAARRNAFGFIGVRFATAPSQSVEVRRVRGNLLTRPNLIISPQGRDEFIRVLQQALDAQGTDRG